MNDNLIIFLFIVVYLSPVLFQLQVVIKERKKGNFIPYKKLIKFFKISLLVLIPIIIFFASLIHTNFLDYEKPIPYQKIDSITFRNFRGLEFFKKTLYGNKRFAYIVSEIEFEVQGDSLYVETYFHPSRSFVYNNYASSEELLRHELYHFKIAELHSRLIKSKIDSLNYIEEEKIYDIVNEELINERIHQKEYDYDTFHSYVYKEQKKYEKEVDSLLDLYSNYRNPKIKLNAKN